MDLPEDLRAALEEQLATARERDVTAAVARLSGRYRSGAASSTPTRLTDRADLQAYLAYRVPATFAAVAAALGQVRRRAGGWAPTSVLDVGAGPGVAAWGATEVWPDVATVTLVERDRLMTEAGKTIFASAQRPALRSAQWVQADLRGEWEAGPADLVIASYVLGELKQDERMSLAQRLWDRTSGVLLLLEPGTPSGFARIRAVRDQLIGRDANIIAPCPHNGACPMADGNWCHFAARVQRTALHRRTKHAALAHEDEKFSYVAATRLEAPPGTPRVLRHPQVRSGHVYLELCTADGLERRVVSRRDGEPFRRARQTRWGDALDR